MQISTVRTELANAASAIEGLTCYGFTPDAIAEPCFYTGEVEIEANNSFGGYDVARITCRVLVSRADDQAGQKQLDDFLSRTGERSVRAAILAARGEPGEAALNGAADDLSIDRVQGYRLYKVGEYQYFGGEIIVRVIGSDEGL